LYKVTKVFCGGKKTGAFSRPLPEPDAEMYRECQEDADEDTVAPYEATMFSQAVNGIEQAYDKKHYREQDVPEDVVVGLIIVDGIIHCRY
jgi:hypothetical protein